MFSKKGRKPWRLAARLIVWHAASVTLLIIVATIAAHVSVTWNDEKTLARSTRDGIAKFHEHRDVYLTLARNENPDLLIRVIDPAGAIKFDSPRMIEQFPASVFPEPGTPSKSLTLDGRPYTLFSERIDRWTYQIAIDRSFDQAYLVMLYRNIAIITIPTLCVALIGGYFMARAGLKPLQKLATDMREITADHLDRRIPTEGVPAELRVVASDFNEVVDRLGAAVTRLDQFSADVAHELRVPLHNLRATAEATLDKDRPPEAYRAALAHVVDESDQLARLIDRLLLLARLANPRAGLHIESVDIQAELEKVRDFFEAAATQAGVVINVSASGVGDFAIDQMLFQRGVSNLVANALRYTPAGGIVTLAASVDSTSLNVSVTDTGTGISPEHLSALFDRYARQLDAKGSGLGLGLEIVKRVAELHGGKATLTSEVHHGTTACMHFPRQRGT